MRQAGCISVDFGVESGSEEILGRLGKNTTKDQARKAFQHCRALGLSTRAFFMIGTPWETPQTVEETISFAKELRPTISLFFLAVPYPGTALREEFSKAGWPIPDNYDEYRHWTTSKGSLLQRGRDESSNPQAFFARECRRATNAFMISQILDFRHYPELLRAYLRRYSLAEAGVRLLRELKRLL
jgi:radical SAM superfamily enzyme YgiQ (UPF0313 family)